MLSFWDRLALKKKPSLNVEIFPEKDLLLSDRCSPVFAAVLWTTFSWHSASVGSSKTRVKKTFPKIPY